MRSNALIKEILKKWASEHNNRETSWPIRDKSSLTITPKSAYRCRCATEKQDRKRRIIVAKAKGQKGRGQDSTQKTFLWTCPYWEAPQDISEEKWYEIVTKAALTLLINRHNEKHPGAQSSVRVFIPCVLKWNMSRQEHSRQRYRNQPCSIARWVFSPLKPNPE